MTDIIKVRVDTRRAGYVIEQVTSSKVGEREWREMTRRVVDIQEAGMRQALIDMGWTPPKEVGK